MNDDLPVLIVGAGPTGLVMASELARHGITFRIIDKKPDRTISSNATWIQTRTIELFDHLDIANRFIKIANLCHAINLYVDGKSLVKIPLDQIESAYPFILMLPQSETERLLNEHLEELNKKVERSLDLINVKQSNNKVISTIQFSDGRTENITSDWLIACDGANSTVRDKCQIIFPGEDLSEQFIVADAQIDSHMSKDEAHIFFDKGTVFAAFPLGGKQYRITANLHLDYPRKIFTEKSVIEIAQERAHGAYYIKNVSWISPFWIHGKVVDQMRHHSIFFAGDAAHIHSPAGGQGMNTGIQDAYNLAWKLALVIKGRAKSSLLDSYHKERFPVVSEIVKETDRYTKMVLFDKSFLTKLNRFSKKLLQNKLQLSKKIAEELTQVNFRYENSPIIDYKNAISKLLQSGERAPDVKINKTTNLYHYFRNTKHNILLFPDVSPKKNNLAKTIELQKILNQTYSDLVETHIVLQEELADIPNVIVDPNGIIREKYQIKNSGVYVIRPDNYIAYCSKNLDHTLIEDLFKHYLVKHY